MKALRIPLAAASSLALLFTLLPVRAGAASRESCEEVAETCLENCHVDYGMEKMREELTRCMETCQSRLESCADMRQEQKRNQFRVNQEAGSTPRRGDPPDVYRHEDARDKDPNVKPAPYEDVGGEAERPTKSRVKDDDDSRVNDEPRPKKKQPEAESDVEARQQAKAEKARQNDPDADNPPVKKKEDKKKKGKDLSGDDWAKE
ncbi:MAG: hypothetical protein QM765_19765 [Myxococcales bacterium]